MGETQSPPKKLRSRQCMFVLYPESQETAIKYAQENFPCAWALHDKDVHTEKAYQAYIEKNGEPPEWRPGDLKKPHIHFVCSFPNARYFSGIARDLGVPVNTIRKVNNLYKAYVYLWHMLDPDKYQYSKDIVGSHEFEEPSEHAGMTQMEDDQVQILLDMPTFDTFNELCRWVYEQGCWATFRKNYSMWRDQFLERQRLREMAQSLQERLALQERIAALGNSQKVTDVDGFGIMPDSLKGNF